MTRPREILLGLPSLLVMKLGAELEDNPDSSAVRLAAPMSMFLEFSSERTGQQSLPAIGLG